MAAARAHLVAEFLSLFGGQTFPARGHRAPPFGAMRAMISEASEQNPAEGQQPEGLPEGNQLPSEQRRQQPVPQMHDQFAAQPDKEHDGRWGQKKYPFPFHV